MTFKVIPFGFDEARQAIQFLRRDAAAGPSTLRRILMREIGRQMRDRVRKNITEQKGPSGQPWPKLSKWTRAQTGRRKALVTLRTRIKFQATPKKVTVFFQTRDDGWDLSMHDEGFTEQATNKFAVVKLKKPGVLRTNKEEMVFRDTKPKVVPARPVWSDAKQMARVVEPIVQGYLKRLDTKIEDLGFQLTRV